MGQELEARFHGRIEVERHRTPRASVRYLVLCSTASGVVGLSTFWGSSFCSIDIIRSPSNGGALELWLSYNRLKSGGGKAEIGSRNGDFYLSLINKLVGAFDSFMVLYLCLLQADNLILGVLLKLYVVLNKDSSGLTKRGADGVLV